MNRTVEYGVRVTPAGSGTPLAAQIPLSVPVGTAFRVRRAEFRWRALPNADSDVTGGISKINQEAARPSANALLTHNQYMAFFSWAIEVVTTGTTAVEMFVRQELWEYDYRLVMPPTAHLVVTGNLGIEVAFFLYGEMVPMSQGQRNAAIAYQGGLF